MSAGRTRPHRVTVDFDEVLYEGMVRARLDDHLTNSDRIRALVALALEDSDLSTRVVQKASQLARERMDT